MNLTEGFLLGISTGALCVFYCGPIIIPFLLSEGKNVGQSTFYLSLFLSGRMIAYLITGFLAGLPGATFIQSSKYTNHIIGIIYIVISVLLIAYGFYQFREICLGLIQQKINTKFRKYFPKIVPLISGGATGLNICPSFLIAITKASTTDNITSSILFFLLFFLGTSIYFLPLPFAGFIKRQQILRIIGRFAMILTGLIILYQGIIMALY